MRYAQKRKERSDDLESTDVICSLNGEEAGTGRKLSEVKKNHRVAAKDLKDSTSLLCESTKTPQRKPLLLGQM